MLGYISLLKSKKRLYLGRVEEEMYKVIKQNKDKRKAKFWWAREPQYLPQIQTEQKTE